MVSMDTVMEVAPAKTGLLLPPVVRHKVVPLIQPQEPIGLFHQKSVMEVVYAYSQPTFLVGPELATEPFATQRALLMQNVRELRTAIF